MDIKVILEVAAVLLGGGGIISGIVALFKIRPEVARVTVSAAEGAVIVQQSVITSLSNEIERLKASEQDCNSRMEAMRRAFEAIDERKNRTV